MKESSFISDGYVTAMVAIGALFNVGLWYYLKSTMDPDAAFVALHFTAASGVDLIGEARELYNLPQFAALLSLINVLCARLAYRYDILSSYVLVSTLPLLNAFAFFNGFLLVSVNG